MSTVVADITQDVYDISDEVARVQAVAANLVTEDDEPEDNLYSGIQQRLLVEPLRASWMPPPGRTPRRARFSRKPTWGCFPVCAANP